MDSYINIRALLSLEDFRDHLFDLGDIAPLELLALVAHIDDELPDPFLNHIKYRAPSHYWVCVFFL